MLPCQRAGSNEAHRVLHRYDAIALLLVGLNLTGFCSLARMAIGADIVRPPPSYRRPIQKLRSQFPLDQLEIHKSFAGTQFCYGRQGLMQIAWGARFQA
jgi:hypothetical protein